MLSQTINSARLKILEELSPLYSDKERSALSRIIICEATGLTFTQILTYPEKALSRSSWDKINKICDDLKLNLPIQYILGRTEFYGLTLKVNNHTLIPRPETEELVDLIVNENLVPGLKVLDIGTGSGAIAIGLAKNLPRPEVTATDISAEAIALASENATENGVKIRFLTDDILNSSLKMVPSFDIIVSNPPYIRESEKENMEANVLNFEPGSALFVPDEEPLVFYQAISLAALKLLRRGGSVYFEINEALGRETSALIRSMGFRDERIIRDINGKMRIISAKL